MNYELPLPMDKFIVSARKYRPQTFETVVGQEHITTTLKNAIKNHQLAHAFLFCGPRGVGKTTCARILAKTINCENQQTQGEACNTCHSCVSFNDGISMNIHELDAASNNSVDDIRSLVEQVRFAPQAGKYKVYIIDEVHMLSSAAFNAFLKTLEEPPPYAIFILATTEKHKILPTILSRCQVFDFKRITLNDTVEHLSDICKKENVKYEKTALQVIAQKSEGCMRDALSIMDKIVSFTNGELNYDNTLEHLNILDAEYFFKLLSFMRQEDLSGALLLFDDINRKGFEGDLVLNGFAEFMRNLLVAKDEKVAALLEVVESFKEKYRDVGKEITTAYLISALNILNEGEINYKAARNKRLHVELIIIKLTYLQQAIELINESGGTRKKVENAKAVSFRVIPGMQKIKEKFTAVISEIETPGQKARLVIDTPAEDGLRPQLETPEGLDEILVAKKIIPKAGMLQNIRQQYANKELSTVESCIPLTVEKLHQEWEAYTNQLKVKKNPAAQSFERAKLRILTDQSFEISCNNNLEQKFIEQEKRGVCEYFQQLFQNKSIHIQIVIGEDVVQTINSEQTLSKREQYQKIVEQYPMVKELKDRLKLDLDY